MKTNLLALLRGPGGVAAVERERYARAAVEIRLVPGICQEGQQIGCKQDQVNIQSQTVRLKQPPQMKNIFCDSIWHHFTVLVYHIHATSFLWSLFGHVVHMMWSFSPIHLRTIKSDQLLQGSIWHPPKREHPVYLIKCKKRGSQWGEVESGSDDVDQPVAGHLSSPRHSHGAVTV